MNEQREGTKESVCVCEGVTVRERWRSGAVLFFFFFFWLVRS